MASMLHTSQKAVRWDLLDKYQQRYGITGDDEPALRLERSIKRRKAKAHTLRRRIEELQLQLKKAQRELTAVDHEIDGSWQAAYLLVEDQIDEIRRQYGEGWSPVPIFGYRLWAIRDTGLFGYRTQWRRPSLTSTCLNNVPGEDVPHSVHRCGPPACGTYATKSLKVLREELGITEVSGYAVGVVALTGKVIEHDQGYRAAHASVAAISATVEMQYLNTNNLKVIQQFFQRPTETLDEHGTPGPPNLRRGDDYLKQWKELNDTWTWEKNSE